ncbi:MAG: hypothetical protein A4E69_00427 [Syntrophus sp. PtaB.Bin138]|jgi:hypothetical protein|nr:MAG: hypothetical protein A4E69_00427 [Syntrophus sp. PtaB.Bin138]
MEWLTEARKQVDGILSKFPRDLAEAAKETAVELLSEELKKIPVPLVGTILSKAVKQALKSRAAGGPGIGDVLELLQDMQRSDDDFLHGLTALGEDVDRLNALIGSVVKLVEETKSALTVPKLIISEPEYNPKYPVSDNELNFCLMNIGGGAVKVPEMNLIVEKCEPETKIDYTAPAAPPIFLRLKVRLSPNTLHYPLLQLNNEPFRRYGAHAEGAEDVCVQMSSETNARYYTRIRIPYKEMTTDQDKELVYPPLDKPPIPVSFPYAPCWDRHVTPDNMLGREAVLTEIINTFGIARLILEETSPSDDAAHYKLIDEKLHEIGFFMGLGYLPYVLDRFIPPVARMIKAEKQYGALKVVLELTHQTMRYPRGQFFGGGGEEAIEALCDLVDKEDVKRQIREFFQKQDEQSRQEILTKVCEAI